MLKVGQVFPDFKLNNQDGQAVSLEDLKGQPAVVYFYPKDNTPGCTAEACEFRDAMPSMKGAKVIGVSPDSEKAHRKFIEKYNLNFSLLADTDHVLAEQCGLWVEKTMYGRKYMGVERTTYLLDASGKISKIWSKVQPVGHAAQVRAELS